MDDRYLAVIGMTTILWGQVDRIMDDCLTFVYNLDETTFKNLFSGKMVGPKNESLKAGVNRISGEEAKKAIVKMCDAISKCLADRNTMTHGVWGWHWHEKEQVYEPCSRSIAKNRLFFLRDLPDLYERVNEAAVLADRAFAYLAGLERHDLRNRISIYAENFGKPGNPPLVGPPPRYER